MFVIATQSLTVMSFPEPPQVQRKFRSMSLSTGGLLGGQNSRPHSAHSAQSASSNSSFDSSIHPPWPSSPSAPGRSTCPIALSGPFTPNLLSPHTGPLSFTPGHSPGCRDREEAAGGYSRLLDRFKKLTLELELREVSVKQLQEELERSRESEARTEMFLTGGSDSEDSLRSSNREELILYCRKQDIRVQQLEKKISELEFSVQSRKKLVAKRDDTIKSILNQMQSKTVELKQLQDFVSGVSPRSPHHSHLEVDQSETHLRLKEKEKLVLELESEIGETQVRVSELQRELSVCQTDKKRVTELEKQVNGLETKNRELGGLLQTRSQHIAHLEGSVAELSQLVAEFHAPDNTSLEPVTPDRTPPGPDPIISKLSSIVTSAEKMCTGGQGSSSLAAAQISLIRAELKEKNKILTRQREQLNRLTELNTNASPAIASWLDSKERENLQDIIRELNADKQQMTEQLVHQDVELNAQRLRITGLLTELEVEKRESISLRDKSQELANELEENCSRVNDLEKVVESRGKKLNMYKRTNQAERVQHQQVAEAQKEMRGDYEGQLDRYREQLANERRRSVELSGALEDGVTVVFDREKELGEEKKFVSDLLSDLQLLSSCSQMDSNLFKQERKKKVQETLKEQRAQRRELVLLRQELLQHTISEKDALIALIEHKPPGKDEVDMMLQKTSLQKERRMLLDQLRKENTTLATLMDPLPNGARHVGRKASTPNEYTSIVLQLADAPINEVKQSLIQIFTGIQQLRLYLDQVLALVLEYKPSLLEGMPRIQVTPYNLDSSGPRIPDQWDTLSRDKLLNQLETYEKDNLSLQQYISQLLERVVIQMPYLVDKLRAIDKPIVNILKEN